MKLMCVMGAQIPALKSRAERLVREAAQKAAFEKVQEKEAKKANKKK
jgi:hypothetical protein